MKRWIQAAALGVGLAAWGNSVQAQQPQKRLFVEGLGGAVVPTFDIDDVAKTGGAVGAALGYRVNDRWVVLVNSTTACTRTRQRARPTSIPCTTSPRWDTRSPA